MGLPPQVNERISSFKSSTGSTSRGENYSVLKKLESIEFVDGTSGGMTPAVAYIQYWTRNGVARRKLRDAAGSVFSLPPDKLSELTEQFKGAFEKPVSESNIDYFDPDIEIPPFTSVPENLEIAEFRPPVDLQKGTENTFALPSEPLEGGIYGANPVSNYTDMETSAVWTFMFNPEELELSSGPDYNRAEAWGVSDPANEGQPLSWKANRNRKLSFGKVLLHGYSLGKRVDSLEKGLQDLFMARDGENGADGPPVLEFVWGRRVFGPCVIQDIKVREKAWDAGYLVNAEVSFTLEQVPEWTINDGFVDVLRPGRQPTLSDPTVSSRDYRDTSTPEEGGEGDRTPKEGGEEDLPLALREPTTSKSKELQQIIKKCDRNRELSKKYGEFLKKVNSKVWLGFNVNRKKVSEEFVRSRDIEFKELFNQFKNLTPGSSRLPKQYSLLNVRDDLRNIYLTELEGRGDDISLKVAITYIDKCKAVLRKAGTEVRKIVDEYYKGEECREAPKKLKELSEAATKKNERQFLCKSVKENGPCRISIGINEIITNPCNNKVFKCSVKNRDPKELVYKEIK